jgi:hypothetical protein
VADAALSLGELVDEFQEMAGRRPWAMELAELLTLELLSLRGDLIDDLPPGAQVRIETVPAAQLPPGGSLVGELDDAAFVAAGELLADIAGGTDASRYAVAAALELLLRASAGTALGDEPPVTVSRIAIVAKSRAPKPKVGDVVAIHASGDKAFLATVVAKNRFGTAFGLFQGRHDPADVPTAASHPKALAHPVYADDDPVTSGRWSVIGHEPGLAKLFPSDPEIYHYGDEGSGKPDRAETAEGKLRDVGADEAREVGLADESYRQVYVAEQLERRLADSEA